MGPINAHYETSRISDGGELRKELHLGWEHTVSLLSEKQGLEKPDYQLAPVCLCVMSYSISILALLLRFISYSRIHG